MGYLGEAQSYISENFHGQDKVKKKTCNLNMVIKVQVYTGSE